MTARTVPALAEDVALRRLALARWSLHPTTQGAAVVGTSWADSSDDVRDAVTALAEQHGWMGLGVPEDTPIVLCSPRGHRTITARAYLDVALADPDAVVRVVGRLARLATLLEDAVAREASRVHRAYRTRQLARRRRSRR